MWNLQIKYRNIKERAHLHNQLHDRTITGRQARSAITYRRPEWAAPKRVYCVASQQRVDSA